MRYSKTLIYVTQHSELLTSKEGLHLNAPHPACPTVPKNKAFNIDDTLAINEELKFTVGLAGVIELDTLADIRPFACGKFEGPTPDRSTIYGVAKGFRFDIANSLVLRKRGRKIGVEFTISLTTPHETG